MDTNFIVGCVAAVLGLAIIVGGIAIFMGDLFARNPYDVMFDARLAQRGLQVS